MHDSEGPVRPEARPARQKETVSADLAGPLDRAVRTLFGVAWGRARSWIRAGKVRVGDEVALDPIARVDRGAEIVVDESAPRRAAGRLADGDVVHVDTHVIVVAKRPGVDTVPFEVAGAPFDARNADTLEARVRAWIERSRFAEVKSRRPGLGVVHRLDRETSGLVVFARTWLAKRGLSAQFRRHTILRRYLAIANGAVPSGTLRSWLVANRGDGLRGSARGAPPAGAREAVTHVEALEALPSATLVACRLETGRTHQIRIHLSESGHPLAGERVYIRRYAGPAIEAPRLMLHAAELGFVHPATGREMRWASAVPDDMASVLERLRRHRGRDRAFGARGEPARKPR